MFFSIIIITKSKINNGEDLLLLLLYTLLFYSTCHNHIVNDDEVKAPHPLVPGPQSQGPAFNHKTIYMSCPISRGTR